MNRNSRAIPTLKISISGVRGVLGDSLTPILLARFAQAFGTYVGSGTVVIGRDSRTSGEMVKQAVTAGLLSSGCRVLDIGMCPVPTIQLFARLQKAQGGIAITASHNPAEWNALKFIGPAGFFLDAGQARELLDIYHQGEYTKVSGQEMRQVEQISGAIDLHIAAIMRALGPLPKREKPLRVVLDACNGAGSIAGPRLIEALGAEVIPINVTPDGSFPRPAEPLPENLSALRNAVIEHRADVGFAQDMDADRLAVVSNKGDAVGEEYTLVLATSYVLEQQPGPVVANLATSAAMASVVERANCPFFSTRIGEVNVTETMVREQAVIGGEGNGGVIYPAVNFARDSLVGMALILHYLAKTQESVSELVQRLPRFHMIKEKLECPSGSVAKISRNLRKFYANYPQDARDGLKVMLPSGWFLVRGSNTEPIIRIVAEASDETEARKIFDTVYEAVRRELGGSA